MAKPDKSSGVFDNLDKEMEKSTDERFLKLENDGDRKSVYFAGEPHVRYVFWDGQQYQDWTESCGQKKNMRASMNVIVCEVEDKKLTIVGVKVLEQGKRFFQNVSKRDKKYGIQDWIFEIERSGDKGDTDTSYDIDAEYELSDKERKQLEAVELIDLEAFYSELGNDGDKKKREKPEREKSAKEDNTLISDEQRKTLVEMFKTFDDPESEGKKFCKAFGITKVKELPKSKFKKALEYFDEHLPSGKKMAGDDDETVF